MPVINSYYPVISTFEGLQLAEFFSTRLGFETVFESGWYWHLTLHGQSQVNIALLQADHPSVPDAYRKPVQGLLLNFEMDDVTAFYAQHESTQWEIVLPLKDEDWGQRHFIVATPAAGLLLDFIQVIPPSEEYRGSYVGDAGSISQVTA